MEYYTRKSNYIYESVSYLYCHKLWLSSQEEQKTGYTGMLKAKDTNFLPERQVRRARISAKVKGEKKKQKL
jgi:hypothetical protein